MIEKHMRIRREHVMEYEAEKRAERNTAEANEKETPAENTRRKGRECSARESAFGFPP